MPIASAKPLLQFGFNGINESEVMLCRFCPDPDGSGLTWYETTSFVTNLYGLELLRTKTEEYHGECYDTGEFFSHAAELMYELLKAAPEKASLAVFTRIWSAGTKTFTDTVTVKFYGKKQEEVKRQ